jgi:DNA-binding SARP family transcriptional activator
MAVDVLGPLETDAGPLPRRERAILASLVVRRGTAVEPDELADAVWGDRPPTTWRQQIKTGVAEIRARIGRDAIQTVSGAYAFAADPLSVDAVRFESLVAEAREQSVRGEPDRAVDTYRRALSLWRGRAFFDVAAWPPAEAERSRLEQLRVGAEEELLEMRLAAGDARSVVQDAERLVSLEPLREDRWAVLATALYQANRQADALTALRRARERLDSELGIEPGSRLQTLETAILRQDPTLAPPNRIGPVDTACPYPGLRPFEIDDADVFFGRATEVSTIVERVRPGLVTTITGPSGSGKSSVLRAGVVRSLAGRAMAVKVIHPDEAGTATLRAAVFGGAELDVVAIDQFEEVLRESPDRTAAFVTALRDYLESGGAVVLTIRSDSLDAATAIERIGSAIGREVLVMGALSPDGLREAIEEPARRSGLRLETGLVELLLRDAGDRAAILPHLSHALVETWARRIGSTLTVEGYEASGGIAGSIAQAAEERFEALSPPDQAVCRAVLMRLVDRGPDGVTTRRRAPTQVLLEDAARRRVVEQLVAIRLLMIDHEAVSIAHEAVASAWPRLDEWLDDDAEGARLMRRLETDALAWENAHRPSDELAHGARLQATLDWRDDAGPDLTLVESAYLDASAASADRERSALEERAATDRRQNRRLRWALGGAAGLLCVALTSGAVAVVRGNDARTAEDDARIEALAASASALVDSDRDLAALLAAALHERFPDDARARAALFAVLSAPESPTTKIAFAPEERIAAAVLPGTSEVLTIIDTPDDSSAHAEVWDLRTGSLTSTLAAELPDNPTPRTSSVHIDPAGRTAVVLTPTWASGVVGSCCSTNVSVLDLGSGELKGPPEEFPWVSGFDVAFDDDGTTVLLGNVRSRHPIWLDTATLDVVSDSSVSFAEPPVELRVGAVEALRDGTLAVSRPRGVDVYDPITRGVTRTIPTPDGLAQWSFALDESGMLLTAGRYGIARLDPSDGRVLWTQNGSASARCESLVPVPTEGTFICVTDVPWEGRLSDGLPTGRRFDTYATAVNGAALLDDGSLLLVNESGAPFLQRFALDGTGPISTRIAQAHAAADGFVDENTIVALLLSDPADPRRPVESLWDVDADHAVGDAAFRIDVVSRGIIDQWSTDGITPALSDVAGERTWEIDGAPISDVDLVYPVSGGAGALSFAIYDNWIAPFDPSTGLATGIALDFAEKNLVTTFALLSVHEIPELKRAVVTWRDKHRAQTVTTIYDLETGDEIARGLAGDTASIPLPSGEIVSASTTGLQLSSALLEPLLTAPKPIAAGAEFELSDDGRTLLLTGTGVAALYDAATLTSLGSTAAVETESGRGAYLSPNGTRMVTNTGDGILLWNLDPEAMVDAACRMVGRDFTATEWRTYFGDAPQTQTCGATAH